MAKASTKKSTSASSPKKRQAPPSSPKKNESMGIFGAPKGQWPTFLVAAAGVAIFLLNRSYFGNQTGIDFAPLEDTETFLETPNFQAPISASDQDVDESFLPPEDNDNEPVYEEHDYDINYCNVERRNWISREEFEEEYKNKKPIILTNVTQGWNIGAFSKEELVSKYGSFIMKTGVSSYFPRAGGIGHERFTILDYFNYLDNPEIRAMTEEPIYMFERGDFLEYAEDLAREIKKPESMAHFEGGDEIGTFLGVGAKLTGVQFHMHNDAMNVIIKGRKRWLIYPAGQLPPFDYPTKMPLTEWIDTMLPRLSEDRRPIECVQNEGELFYIPEAWYHAVLNIEDTIAVATQIPSPETHYNQELQHITAAEREQKDLSLAILKMYKLNAQMNDCINCRSELVRLLYLDGRFDECARVGASLLEKDDWIALNWGYYGACMLRLGFREDAIDALHTAIELDDADFFSRNILAEILSETEPDHPEIDRLRNESWSRWEADNKYLENLQQIQDDIFERLVELRPEGFEEVNPRELLYESEETHEAEEEHEQHVE